jgi:DegV family protein with EDD domain
MEEKGEICMKIVTDSSALYSPEYAKENGFIVLPLCVTLNKKTYREYVDVNSQEFLELIKDGSIPSSSQPAIGETIEVFENEKDDLLVITMADGLSGTYQSTLSARESVENNGHIHIINSYTLCGPHRYLVQKALKLKEEGKDLDTVMQELHKSIATSKSFLIPNDFEFLKRGGRLTPLAAKLGGMLKVVPVMQQTEDGKRLEKYALKRTMKAAVSEIIKNFKEMEIDNTYRIYVSHAGVLKQAEEIVAQLKKSFEDVKIEILELSPVFITQGGPGCIAIQTIKM